MESLNNLGPFSRQTSVPARHHRTKEKRSHEREIRRPSNFLFLFLEVLSSPPSPYSSDVSRKT